MPIKPFDEQIDEIMDEFDFHKVHNIMEHLNWTWVSFDGTSVPTRSELRKQAREHLKYVVSLKEESTQVGSGGFQAEKFNGVLTLRFVLEEWDCYG